MLAAPAHCLTPHLLLQPLHFSMPRLHEDPPDPCLQLLLWKPQHPLLPSLLLALLPLPMASLLLLILLLPLLILPPPLPKLLPLLLLLQQAEVPPQPPQPPELPLRSPGASSPSRARRWLGRTGPAALRIPVGAADQEAAQRRELMSTASCSTALANPWPRHLIHT